VTANNGRVVDDENEVLHGVLAATRGSFVGVTGGAELGTNIDTRDIVAPWGFLRSAREI
jgi:hypothetical protein